MKNHLIAALKFLAATGLFLLVTVLGGYLINQRLTGLGGSALFSEATTYLYGLCVSAGIGIIITLVWLILNIPAEEKPAKAQKPAKVPKPTKATQPALATATTEQPPAPSRANEPLFTPYLYSGLANHHADGIPVEARLIASPEGADLQISLARPANTLLTGDSAGCKAVMGHMVRILGQSDAMPSFVITDTDGELFYLHAKALSERGYSVNVLDFSGVYSSPRYNPLLFLWEQFEEYTQAESGIFKRRDTPAGSGLTLHNPPHEFGEIYYEYLGRAYADSRELVEVIQKRKQCLYEALCENARAVAALLYAETDSATAGGTAVDDAAKELLDMLEDSKNPAIDMTRERFTLALLNRNLTKTGKTPLPGVFCGEFTAGLTSACDFGARHFFERPTALFMISGKDYQAQHSLAALFSLSLYHSLADARLDGELPGRSVYLLLESFGLMPKIERLEKQLAAQHPRRVWLVAAAPGLDHLNALYGSDCDSLKECFAIQQTLTGKGDAQVHCPGAAPLHTVFTPVRQVPFYMPAETQANVSEAETMPDLVEY